MSTTHVSDVERKAQSQIKSAANVTLLIGIASLMLGVFSLTLDTRVVDPANAINIPIGVVMMALSFFIRRRSPGALWIAIGLYAVTGLLNLITIASASSPSQYALGTLIARVIFLIPLVRAIGAINTLKQPAVPSPAPEMPQG